MGDRQAYDKRRREYVERLPSHYCVRCSAVVYLEDAACIDCGAAQPEGSWPTIQDGFDPWIGRVLDGRYLVTKRVGQGAMGSVYRVESLVISREFAIKIINFKQTPSGVDPAQLRSRLQREIEAISRLRNPHVVPFYELLELFDSFVGIIMDYVSGDTLDELVGRVRNPQYKFWLFKKRKRDLLRSLLECTGAKERYAWPEPDRNRLVYSTTQGARTAEK